MLVEERTSNGGSMGCSVLVPCGNGAALNGHTFGSEGNNTDGSIGEYSECSADGLRTYKRRKHLRPTAGTEPQNNGRVSVDAGSQTNQEPGHYHENSLMTHTQLQDSKVPDRSQYDTSNGSQNKGNNQADVRHITNLCQRVLHNVKVSEKFDLLCKLLCENFQGVKVDSILDFLSVVNSRMKDGAYEQSPVLFSTDLQQVWHKIQKIGSEMVYLSKGLSDLSQNSYRALVGGSTHPTSEEGKNEEINQVGAEQGTKRQYSAPESDHETKLEKKERGSEKINNCKQCGVEADGKDRLVCDSCEEMYHVSCIEPALEAIPSRSWYCANCTASGIESPHENCAVCERINDARTQINGSGETLQVDEDMLSDLEESSDCSTKAEDGHESSNGNGGVHYCKLCENEEEDSNRLRKCGHPHCPNKYYHLRCLTTEELKSYGPRWYCPSCLCRACLTDKDDKKIVLCDGCDHAYHIYCMEPPHTSIPRGKWFCSQCDAGIKAINKAKRAYEEKQYRKQLGGSSETVGRVDMLLNAAEKLRFDEKFEQNSVREKKEG